MNSKFMYYNYMNAYFAKGKSVYMLYIKKHRQTKGLSQYDVAKALDISVRMYQYLEAGQRNPSWKVAQRMEQFFGIPASELLAQEKSLE